VVRQPTDSVVIGTLKCVSSHASRCALSNTSYDLLWAIISSERVLASSGALMTSSDAPCRAGARDSGHNCSPGELSICSALGSTDGAPNNEAALGSGGSLSD
jgi:hypothetical protein